MRSGAQPFLAPNGLPGTIYFVPGTFWRVISPREWLFVPGKGLSLN